MTRSLVLASLLIVLTAPALAAGLEAVADAECPETSRRSETVATEPAPAPEPAAATRSEPVPQGGGAPARRARWHSLLPGMYK